MNSSKRLNWKFQLSPTEVTLLLLFVILFLPTFATFRNISSSLAYSIESLMWRLLFYRDGSVDFRIVPYFFMLQDHLLKYLLVIQFHRYNRHATTKKRVLLVAILSELQMFLLTDMPQIIEGIQELHAWTAFVWYVPIPIVLFVSIILLKVVPRPESKPMWIDKEEQKTWWEKKQQENRQQRMEVLHKTPRQL